MNKIINFDMTVNDELFSSLADDIAEEIANGDSYYDRVKDLYYDTGGSLFGVSPDSGLNEELDSMLDNARDEVYEDAYEMLLEDTKDFYDEFLKNYKANINKLTANQISQSYPEYEDKISIEGQSIIIKDCNLSKEEIDDCFEKAYEDWLDKADEELEIDDYKDIDLYQYGTARYDEGRILERLSETVDYFTSCQDIE